MSVDILTQVQSLHEPAILLAHGKALAHTIPVPVAVIAAEDTVNQRFRNPSPPHSSYKQSKLLFASIRHSDPREY